MLINNLRLLEIKQAQIRKEVRIALRDKNVAEIKKLSEAIRINRRKPNGLRDLNNAIRQLYIK